MRRARHPRQLRRPPGSSPASGSSATATAFGTAAGATASWSPVKLTRDDEEVTVAFRDPASVARQMLASLANLEIVG